MYVIQFPNQHLPTFAVLYIKQSLHIANTETFQPQKKRCSTGFHQKKNSQQTHNNIIKDPGSLQSGLWHLWFFLAFSQFRPTVCLYISFTACILILPSAKQSLPPVNEYSPPANENNRLSLDTQEPPLYKTGWRVLCHRHTRPKLILSRINRQFNHSQERNKKIVI